MSQDKAATQRVGICWADYETFWWNATSEPTCPECHRDDEGYAERHGFFVVEARLQAATDALNRAAYIAEHLFQMVPGEVWREHGGDDGQGHYEGDYHAEKLRDEIAALRVFDSSQDSQT